MLMDERKQGRWKEVTEAARTTATPTGGMYVHTVWRFVLMLNVNRVNLCCFVFFNLSKPHVHLRKRILYNLVDLVTMVVVVVVVSWSYISNHTWDQLYCKSNTLKGQDEVKDNKKKFYLEIHSF